MPELPPDDPRPLTPAQRETAACDWSDYRSAYGASGAREHQAFLAGRQAAATARPHPEA